MDVKLPQLAEGVEGGTVVSILVAEGQMIEKDQAFMELETQKAVGSIPAPSAGVVTKIHVKQGMEVSVGQTLISIETAAAKAPAPSTAAQANPIEPAGVTPPPAITSEAPATLVQTAPTDVPDGSYRYESKSGMAPPASPAIRKIARELDIDLTRVRGSEAGGRINLADLRSYVQKLQQM
ncbi:MAG TPA: biotin/lipoyl-containing protein, partial [Candidatus Binatia bacterium]